MRKEVASNGRQFHSAVFASLAILCLPVTLIAIAPPAILDDHIEQESAKPGSICCLVLTSPKYFLTRARAINATWGPRCDRLLFISELPRRNAARRQKQFARRIPIAPIPNIPPGYKHLTKKTTLAFLFAYKHLFNQFDWFVKADDDTYLMVNHLRAFLQLQDTSEPVTFGYNFKVHVDDGYHSGGASYVLSREALRRLHRAHQQPNNTNCQSDGGMEDIEVAKCLRSAGVYIGRSTDENNLDLFHPLSLSAHFLGAFPSWLDTYAENPLTHYYNCCSAQSISFHYMKPQDIYLLDFLLYGLQNDLQTSRDRGKLLHSFSFE